MTDKSIKILNRDYNISTKVKFLRIKYQLIHKIAPYSHLDDRFFIEFKYFQIFRKSINLRNPALFNEKLQWLKLFNHDPLYTKLVDKYSVREIIIEKIGSQYLNKILGVFETPEEINWDSLPDRFVLKTNHGCGKNIIGHKKHDLNPNEVKLKFNYWLKQNYYYRSREWPYKNVVPKIICEEYIPWDEKLGLVDYKVYCFNGIPTFIDVHYGRFTVHKSIFYDTDWNRKPFGLIPKETELDFIKPIKLEEMLDVAKALSVDIPFCRVDLYYAEERIIFGEITFFPGGGFLPFHPDEYNEVVGNMIQLPKRRARQLNVKEDSR